jgi:GTPase SAR1 family protein
MGVGGVGKSAITNRFVIGRWVEKVKIYVLNFFLILYLAIY